MKPHFLLPNQYKKIGLFLAPAGLLIWSLAQQRCFDKVLVVNGNYSLLITLLIISFFSFIAGLYFLTFSKEKTENDSVNQIRLYSFQVATSVQFLLIVASCIYSIIIGNEPSSVFLAGLLIVYWGSYILYFNYLLSKVKKQQYK